MTELEKKIFNYLLECGCCRICAVRYLCNKTIDLGDLDTYLIENAYIATQNGSPQIEAKKLKTNPCTVCLGLLQEFCLHEILRSSDLSKAKEYDSPTFTCSISMSPTVLLREHSMKLHLLDKFPNFYTDDNVEIPLNRAWKMFVKNQLGESVGKIFENSDVCNFSINVAMQYKFDLEELDVLKSMQPKIFEQRNTQHRKYNGELFTRKGVLNALSLTSSGVFKMYAVVPPEVPTEFLSCKAIDCKHNAIYVAGRYCKFSRNLSQSPWIIDGNKMMDTSVQEVIFEKVSHIFRFDT